MPNCRLTWFSFTKTKLEAESLYMEDTVKAKNQKDDPSSSIGI